MYVVSGSRQRTIRLMDEDKRLGMSPSITQGDLAPDKMSSTKLSSVSAPQSQTGHPLPNSTFYIYIIFLFCNDHSQPLNSLLQMDTLF